MKNLSKRLDALESVVRGPAQIFIVFDDTPPRYRLDGQEVPESIWLALVKQARPTDYVIRVEHVDVMK